MAGLLSSLSSVTLVAVAAITVILFLALVYFFIPPASFPRNIPAIPFYYALLPLVKDGDQEALYHTYLEPLFEQHGAAKIFFGGRWNILVQRPSYIAEVFKYEDTYAKSGNQKKIPYSVLAEYTGDNIISSHGENWKLYRSILQPPLQQDQDPGPIWRNSRLLISLLLEEQKTSPHGSVLLPQLLQRFTLANLSEGLLGTSFQTLQQKDAALHKFQMMLKPLIFDPVFLNFPFLDHFNFPSRQRARRLARQFANELCQTVQRGHQHAHTDKSTSNVGCSVIGAFEQGILSEKQFRNNMVSVFLAGHENPQLLLVSMMFLLGEHQEIQERVREEVLSLGEDELPYSVLQSAPFLTSVIYETLRMYPPISQLINRRTTKPVLLGGKIPLPAGTYIGYNAYATNRDKQSWGADADEFKPERWGRTVDEINVTFRKANAKGAFISFHGGRRACLGQKFAMFEARIAMAEILRSLRWKIDPTWPRRMTPAGPLYPRNLRVEVEKIRPTVVAGL
ncbi:Dit2 protein [Coccidioides immitis RS]|uniref:Dit2 protein n=4 Tax=Coccidioides immitis TaxID=5501 RepID=J3KH68_COCIM|nr:Dit2 protein [Coccidioides immitis RS]EAS35169.3 Dit2 protein [Coccidioides immitis RS]KMP00393.1 cytochrome P450 4A24 [Coccidioides immitis RMSCC 2394]KMU84584.1 cytochrome P450 4A24 [Coccidioides immitis H538.4]TPX26560.1 cytochrome P450-dit2 [Coccidioides immitis]